MYVRVTARWNSDIFWDPSYIVVLACFQDLSVFEIDTCDSNVPTYANAVEIYEHYIWMFSGKSVYFSASRDGDWRVLKVAMLCKQVVLPVTVTVFSGLHLQKCIAASSVWNGQLWALLSASVIVRLWDMYLNSQCQTLLTRILQLCLQCVVRNLEMWNTSVDQMRLIPC